MPIDDPGTWLALKSVFDTFRSAIGMVSDANKLAGGDEQQKQVIEKTLATASSSATLAEAEIAKALGYELCKCEFPPTIMKTVGYFARASGHRDGDPVFECPKCGYNNAGPWMFERLDTKPRQGGDD